MSTPTNTVEEFVDENYGLISRMLTHGNSEARGYALAVLANGGSDDDIEQVMQALEDLKTDTDEDDYQ